MHTGASVALSSHIRSVDPGIPESARLTCAGAGRNLAGGPVFAVPVQLILLVFFVIVIIGGSCGDLGRCPSFADLKSRHSGAAYLA